MDGRELVDTRLVRHLAAGRLREANERLDAGGAGDAVVALLVRGELASRRGRCSIASLADLAARVAVDAGDRPLLRWWANALIGERCLLELDGDGAAAASRCLAEVDDDPLVPLTQLWVRGRLRRLAAMAALHDRPPDLARHDRLRAAALTDFGRADLPVEMAATRLVDATLLRLWLGDESPAELAAAVDAGAALRLRAGPEVVAVVDLLLVLLGLLYGDADAVDEALARAPDPAAPGALPAVWGVLRAVAAARPASSGSGPVDLEDAFAALQRSDPRLVARLRLVAAGVLADAGRLDDAGRVAAPAHRAAGLGPDRLAEALTQVRMAMAAGDAALPAGLHSVFDALEDDGHGVRAIGVASRLARDLAAAGRPGDADAVGAWRPRAAPSAASRAPSPRPGLIVRVLAPTVEVTTVEGEAVPLRASAARLLVALVVAHPAPVHVEQLADELWPDTPWPRTRLRLNTLVHRLRRALGPAADGPLRAGPLLALPADGWDIDLVRLRAALAPGADAADRAELARRVTGNLADAQFPYDERLVAERRVVAGALARLAADPVVAGSTGEAAGPVRSGS